MRPIATETAVGSADGRVIATALAIGTGIALVLATGAGAARAADNVDLSGGTAATTGDAWIRVDDFAKCEVPATENLTLGTTSRTFTLVDNNGNVFTGNYKQRNPDGRSLIFKLDDASKAKFQQVYNRFMGICNDATAVKSNITSYQLTGRVKKSLDKIRLQVQVRGSARVDGIKRVGTYWFQTRGPLVLP